jgi:hypothetical protein
MRMSTEINGSKAEEDYFSRGANNEARPRKLFTRR